MITTVMRKLSNSTLYSTLTLILLLIIFYYWIDIPVIYWVKAHQHSIMLMHISNVCATVFKSAHWLEIAIIAGLIGLFIRYIKYKPEQAKPWLFFACAFMTAFVIAFVLKFILARYRPIELLQHGVYGFHYFSIKYIFASMPSGHATSVFAGLYAVSCIIKRRWITVLCLIAATLLALTRVIILAHFPSDLILGAFIGITSVTWISYLMNYHIN